jgi:CheY-like chemotaxis protein
MKKEHKILVADDSPEVQEAVKKALKENYELNIVSTPEEAINYSGKFDLLLTDFYFGEDKKRGLEIIKELKEKKKDLSAILMSSDVNNNIKIKCNELNVPTFSKYENNITPVNEDKLRELIKCYLK